MKRSRPPNAEAAAPSDPIGAAAQTGTPLERAGLIVASAASAAGNLWRVSGNTREHRTLLRDAGGRWNPQLQAWEFTDADPSPRIANALQAPARGLGDNRPPDSAPRPHYHGHRERVRQRVLQSGLAGFQDYELLELLLFYAIRFVDTKPMAKDMLARFGSLGDVMAADATLLAELVPDQAARARLLVLFRAVREASQRMARREILNRPLIGSWDKLLDYCHTALQHEKTEQFRILFLDRKNVLIRDEAQQTGTVDHTPVYPREVVKRALELGASSIVMVHNHPSGDPTPSRDDIAMTREVKAAAQALGIELHDHLVIGRNGHTSFRSKGLL